MLVWNPKLILGNKSHSKICLHKHALEQGAWHNSVCRMILFSLKRSIVAALFKYKSKQNKGLTFRIPNVLASGHTGARKQASTYNWLDPDNCRVSFRYKCTKDRPAVCLHFFSFWRGRFAIKINCNGGGGALITSSIYLRTICSYHRRIGEQQFASLVRFIKMSSLSISNG